MADLPDQVLVLDRLQERQVALAELRQRAQLREHDHLSASFLLPAVWLAAAPMTSLDPRVRAYPNMSGKRAVSGWRFNARSTCGPENFRTSYWHSDCALNRRISGSMRFS